jgi:hypothetical protein
MIQLIIMDEVPFGLTHQALGLNFVIRYHSEQALENEFLPVWVGTR